MSSTFVYPDKRARFVEAFLSNGLPHYMVDGLLAWIERGQRPGDFLYGVICNSFTNAVTTADATNKRALKEWAYFMHNPVVPGACWGSAEKAEAWAAHRGEAGRVAP